MAATPIRNRAQQTIGYFEDRNGGHTIAILDRRQVTLGYYEKAKDTTYDARYCTFGKGNQLMIFLAEHL